MKKYNKIVRDRIPEIIERDGKRAVFERASAEDAVSGLEEKLVEEVKEYLESRETEELSDILEVIHGIADLRGIGFEAVEKIRMEKRAERGGFEKGLRLLAVLDNDEREKSDA